MIYLRTGANGSCKTLFTLADVRALQLESGRPVCINGRFKIKSDKLKEFGWQVIDFKDWQAQDDGTIFLIDECHNDLPVRPSGAPVPEPVRMLAEHRSRGFDFFLLTQHPMNIDSFVRKLIGAPGWHQHLKRVMGATKLTSVLQWDAVRIDCEKDGSGKSAQITRRTQPTEVYGWYDSAELHTGKVRIPKQVFVLAACAVLVPALGYVGYRHLMQSTTAPAVAAGVLPAGVHVLGGAGGQGGRREVTPAEYVASFTPRVADLPYTAPRYDGVTGVATAPYPAACVHMGAECRCYTQQATRLVVSRSVCLQVVRDGFFMDWVADGQRGGLSGGSVPSLPAPSAASGASVTPASFSAASASPLQSASPQVVRRPR